MQRELTTQDHIQQQGPKASNECSRFLFLQYRHCRDRPSEHSGSCSRAALGSCRGGGRRRVSGTSGSGTALRSGSTAAWGDPPVPSLGPLFSRVWSVLELP